MTLTARTFYARQPFRKSTGNSDIKTVIYTTFMSLRPFRNRHHQKLYHHCIFTMVAPTGRLSGSNHNTGEHKCFWLLQCQETHGDQGWREVNHLGHLFGFWLSGQDANKIFRIKRLFGKTRKGVDCFFRYQEHYNVKEKQKGKVCHY